VSLKQLADILELNPSTVSFVLNDVPGRTIPQGTRDRIKAMAKQMNYQPSLLARSLRNRQTLTVGILVPELGVGYHTEVLSGIGDHLINAGYSYFTAHHRHRKELVEDYTRMLISRGAQGIIAVDTALEHSERVPTVAIAGHRRIKGVTNVVLNHYRAAQLALTHLHSLGHRCIAFMRGQPFSSDSEERWNAIVKVAFQLGLSIDPELVVRLDLDMTSPELGYPVIERLLATKKPFTALVAFNDVAALGSIRALQDSNLGVPKNISVIGFDDIMASAYTMPRLTTIRQPLAEMGRIATQVLLEEINDADTARQQIEVEPELIVRESTGPVSPRYRAPRS
jgi:LacI family transcriptional regulator